MKTGDKIICVDAGSSTIIKSGASYVVAMESNDGYVYLEGVAGGWYSRRFQLSGSNSIPPMVEESHRGDSTTGLGRKDDNGKVRMELLNDMPRAIKGVAEVLHWAVTDKKPTPYVPGSWQHVDNYYARYTGALMRHQNNIATHGQFAKDTETNLLDLKHLACDILILLELTLREQESRE